MIFGIGLLLNIVNYIDVNLRPEAKERGRDGVEKRGVYRGESASYIILSYSVKKNSCFYFLDFIEILGVILSLKKCPPY